MQTISIDVGRNEVKGFNGVNEVVFSSIVGSHHILDVKSSFTNYDVEINGTKYFVADLAKVESIDKSQIATKSKIHIDTKILLLTALQLLADPKQQFKIITGMPVDQYSVKCKRDLTDYLMGEHIVSVNGVTSKFKIDDSNLVMAQESVASYWNEVCDIDGNEIDPRKFLDKKVRVIDIGSRTINYSTIDNGTFINTESGSLDYGIKRITKKAPSIIAEYDARKSSFTKGIFSDISEQWADYDNDIMLLTGGGSLLLEKHLLSFYKNAIIAENAKMSNAYGMYKIQVADSK